MDRNELITRIEEADMVLVGLGEDFDRRVELVQSDIYKKGCERLAEENAHSLIPAWNTFCIDKAGVSSGEQELQKLATLLMDKNYFVVTVSTNPLLAAIPWKHGRIVMPCGSSLQKQCSKGCNKVIPINEYDELNLKNLFEQLYAGGNVAGLSTILGTCTECNQPYCLNNVYAENYDESGYLEQWSLYMKWLQGTVNRKVLLLELGVGMKFPSVIRWPFEKVAYFNQKSYFCRVHEKLYQLTAELSGKGCGISQNAIDWLRML